MTTMSAAFAAARKLACVLAGLAAVTHAAPAQAEWKAPWKNEDKALVIDAYEFNPINWTELTSDERIAGFINKASDGLPPDWSCGTSTGDDYKLCKNRWWKYSVTKELYMTRREMAKMKGLLWGAYHLGRPGNPREQADHFVDFAEPGADDLIALDIEDNTPEWMSLSDAEIFADQVKIRTGRYPVLYTNGSTADYIARNRAAYPLLSRLPLWYARYRDDITGKFPTETWPSYALWQFSSMHNCSSRSCPYRVKGAKTDIDVNVASTDVAGLKAAWPFDKLIERPEDPAMLVAGIDGKTKEAVARAAAPPVAATLAERPRKDAVDDTLLAAYGPTAHPRLDPLELLNEAAHHSAQPTPATAATAPALAPEIAEKLGAHISSLKQAIADAKSGLGSFFVSEAEAAGAPLAPEEPRAALGAPAKAPDAVPSRFREIMRDAETETHAGPGEDDVTGVLAMMPESRGGRVSPSWASRIGPASPVQRVEEAFAAAR